MEEVHVRGGEGRAGKKKGFRFSLITRIMLVAISPVILVAVLLTVIGVQSIQGGMKQEIFSGFQLLATSVNAAYEEIDTGDWTLQGTNLMKGNFNVTANDDLIDGFTNGHSADITIFYGDTRYATSLKNAQTGERILGTKCDSVVYENVVKKNEVYTTSNITINELQYFACYVPLKNANGSTVGMIFVGEPAEGINDHLNSASLKIILVAVVVSIIALILVFISSLAVKKGIVHAESAVTKLASGTLDINVSSKMLQRSDEIGDMIGGVKKLRDELVGVINNIKNSSEVVAQAGVELNTTATQTNSTADEISRAVEDISKGAVAQAEEIENASAKIETMGNMIERIVEGVSALDEASETMYQASEESSVIIHNLRESSDKTMEAIERIGQQVTATNDSANKISAAIELITSIAEETNLLSLNASIEAARAGEQGRGFAVVANQIQKLAEQSNESALRIAEIIKELLEDSENTVTVMGSVQQIVDEQQHKLEETSRQFSEVRAGIDRSRRETKDIKDLTNVCDEARVGVVDVISNLSAISQENAASTEETTASMEELNATINLLAESAGNLEQLAEELQHHIEFFKI